MKSLTNLHKSPLDFYLFVSELVQVIHKKTPEKIRLIL
jgi:hypothetical protein